MTANWSINFYKKIISPLQGQQVCNFSPSCSQFYKQSINNYGIVVGSLMGADRLIRCNPWAWTYLDKYYYGVDNDRIQDPTAKHYIKISNINERILTANLHPLTANDIVTESGERKAESDLDFADYLFQSQDYVRAIGEYKRLLFFYPDTQDNIKEYIQLMLGESYLTIKNYQQALRYFSLRENHYINYNRARLYYEQGDYLKTRDELDSIIEMGFDEQHIVLYGLSFFKEHDFSSGVRFFQQHAPREASVINELCNFDGKNIRKRSRVASTLSSTVIPGLGQIYSGRWGDGLYSFLTVVGSGLIANYYYHHDESRIKFSIFTFLTAFFWAGNVYGANISARDYNLFQVKKYLQKIENTISGFNLKPNYHNFYEK
jgi:putative component of membrane protein insertase Oxa1/YidC/SpoIIIJ protein YidD